MYIVNKFIKAKQASKEKYLFEYKEDSASNLVH